LVDGVKFDTEKLFTYLINALHLSDIALNESVEHALTVDGAKLNDQVHHVTIGFKICDKRARDPVSGKLVFYETTEKVNLQSATWCFPCMIIIAKDNKGAYDKYFREIFDFCS
jgi:hypothetical protein